MMNMVLLVAQFFLLSLHAGVGPSIFCQLDLSFLSVAFVFAWVGLRVVCMRMH